MIFKKLLINNIRKDIPTTRRKQNCLNIKKDPSNFPIIYSLHRRHV
jgi:hypothetical protein